MHRYIGCPKIILKLLTITNNLNKISTNINRKRKDKGKQKQHLWCFKQASWIRQEYLTLLARIIMILSVVLKFSNVWLIKMILAFGKNCRNQLPSLREKYWLIISENKKNRNKKSKILKSTRKKKYWHYVKKWKHLMKNTGKSIHRSEQKTNKRKI